MIKEAFIRIPIYLFEEYAYLSHGARYTLSLLIDVCRRNNGNRPELTQKDIGELIGCTRKTAAGYLKELENAGLIFVQRSPAGRMRDFLLTAPEFDRFYMLPESIQKSTLSVREKLLFALLLSKGKLSVKNGHTTEDKGQEAYFTYTIEETRTSAQVSRTTAFRALNHITKSGLIDRVYTGIRKPCITLLDLSAYTQCAADTDKSMKVQQIKPAAFEEMLIPEDILNLKPEEPSEAERKETTDMGKNGTGCVILKLPEEVMYITLLSGRRVFFRSVLIHFFAFRMCKKRTQNRIINKNKIADKEKINQTIQNLKAIHSGRAAPKRAGPYTGKIYRIAEQEEIKWQQI